jgi:hypothetical protein
MTYSGKFNPKNPQKYIGDSTNIVWRSLWDRRVMVLFDEDDQIVQWGSEELKIPYRSPVDRLIHHYIPDFLIKARQPDGSHIIRLIEVKPYAQCHEPKIKKKVTKRLLNEIMTYEVNQAKWAAAKAYALDKGWQFIVLTEREIFPDRYHK